MSNSIAIDTLGDLVMHTAIFSDAIRITNRLGEQLYLTYRNNGEGDGYAELIIGPYKEG